MPWFRASLQTRKPAYVHASGFPGNLSLLRRCAPHSVQQKKRRAIETAPQSAYCGYKKQGWPEFRSALSCSGALSLVSCCGFFPRRLVMVVHRSRPRLGLHGVLVDWRRARHVVVERCACRNQVILHLVLAVGPCPHLDAAGVNALLRDQVGLGVHRALRRYLLCGHGVRTLIFRLRSRHWRRVADHHQRGIRLLLSVQPYVIQASLGFVVDSRRTPLVLVELDRAKRLRLRSRRRRRRFHIDRGCR